MWLRRARPARVAIVDDDLDVAVALAAAIATDPRLVVWRVLPSSTPEESLGELLAGRADLVVLDLDLERPWRGDVLACSLRNCGAQVVARTRRLDPPLPPGTAVVGKERPLDEVVDAVRVRLPALRGRPGPPAVLAD